MVYIYINIKYIILNIILYIKIINIVLRGKILHEHQRYFIIKILYNKDTL